MPFLPFPEYRPDVDDFRGQHTQALANVLPRGDGWGPVPDLQGYTDALPGPCRGIFYARNPSDGTVVVFAGTVNNLYTLDNTTLEWTEVSKDGNDYSDVPDSDHWQFDQFGSVVIAVQANTDPQAFTVGSSNAFADLAGSPPAARYVRVVGRFLVLTGLTSDPRRVQWSGLDDITEWTPGTDFSNFVDLPDGGIVRGVAGGEFGLIFQDTVIRRMVYIPGETPAFQIERITEDQGLLSAYSIVRAGPRIFYVSQQGFHEYTPGGGFSAIGKEKVDRTFLADIDQRQLHMLIGASDPTTTRAYWAYKSVRSSTDDEFDTLVCYDYGLQRWSPPIAISGQYLASLVKPGTTLEGLDSIGSLAITGAADNGSGEIRIEVADTSTLTTGQIVAISGVGGTTEANGNWTITVIDGTHFDLDGSTFTNAYTSGGIVGGSIDDITFSFDSVQRALVSRLAGADTDNRVGFFDGSNLAATLETPEQGLEGRYMYVRGLEVRTDAPTVYGSVKHRANAQSLLSTTTETLINAHGVCPQRVETKLARAKIRIPAGTSWTYAMGVEPDFVPAGRQ